MTTGSSAEGPQRTSAPSALGDVVRVPARASAVRRARGRRRRARRRLGGGRVLPRRHDDLLAGRRAGGAPARGPRAAPSRSCSTARVLDLLGPGELFGHASMLSGLPPGFTARAQRGHALLPDPRAGRALGAGAAGERRFRRALAAGDARARAVGVARASAGAAIRRTSPSAALIRGARRVRAATATIREAAAQMTDAGATAVVIELRRSLGHPHRPRPALARRRRRRRPTSAGQRGHERARPTPSTPDRLGGDVLLEMLDRGIRHFPVVTARGELIGVVEAVDLHRRRDAFLVRLRRAIARADTFAELAPAAAGAAARGDRAARRASSPRRASRRCTRCVLDALTRRLIEMAIAELGEPEVEFAWLALGSQARREATPGSDVDSAIVVVRRRRRGRPSAPRCTASRSRWSASSSAAACAPDRHGATASDDPVRALGRVVAARGARAGSRIRRMRRR